ncbi:hypothetical protein BJX66DRAFT_297993 [Aspergillus keveii]|uniref:Secreted protein n=1 Tax=Aspergillus keveii TaxID=714993 RepID=A0ABR4GE65_9EURO
MGDWTILSIITLVAEAAKTRSACAMHTMAILYIIRRASRLELRVIRSMLTQFSEFIRSRWKASAYSSSIGLPCEDAQLRLRCYFHPVI